MHVPPPNQIRGRVVLIGDASVGKTSILSQLIEKRFDAHQTTTIGANYQSYTADVGTCKIEMQIWDTAGQEKFRSLGPIYYRNAAAAVAVFDVTNHVSFENLHRWMESFREVAGQTALVVLVANKVDKRGNGESPEGVTREEAKEFARENRLELFETSALAGTGIDGVFLYLSEAIVKAQKIDIAPSVVNQKREETAQCKC
jgi:small GTP-binding protein